MKNTNILVVLPLIAYICSYCYNSSNKNSFDGISDILTDEKSDIEITEEEIESNCPPGEGINFNFTIESPQNYISKNCIISSLIGENNDKKIIELDCEIEDKIKITLENLSTNDYFNIMLFQGENVYFRLLIDRPWWENIWFTISDLTDNIIIGGIDADSLYPYQHEEILFNPLSLSSSTLNCEPTIDYCYKSVITAVRVVHSSGIETLVPDSSKGTITIGDEIASSIYYIYVDQAVRRYDFECTDIPSAWYKILISFIPGD